MSFFSTHPCTRHYFGWFLYLLIFPPFLEKFVQGIIWLLILFMAYKLKIVRFFLSLVCIFGGMNLNFIIKILNKFLDFIGIGKFFTKDAGEDSLEKGIILKMNNLILVGFNFLPIRTFFIPLWLRYFRLFLDEAC